MYWMQTLAQLLGMGGAMRALGEAPTLAAQRAAWDGAWFVRFCHQAPAWLVDFVTRCIAILCFNRFVMWCAHTATPLSSHPACPLLLGTSHAGMPYYYLCARPEAMGKESTIKELNATLCAVG